MDVSVIIVNYKTCNLTLQCLESVYRMTSGGEFEVILVDNHSADGSVDAIGANFPSVRLIEIMENLGFGRANNVGADQSLGKYLFLLNSDTVLVENDIGFVSRK